MARTARRAARPRWTYTILTRARRLTDSVLCGFSGGKDGLVLLDMCAKAFRSVQPFYMYYVPDIEYQQTTVRWVEQHYGVTVLQLPHFELSALFNEAFYRFATPETDVAKVTLADFETALRQKTGIGWIAYGHQMNESLQRRGMLNHVKGIDVRWRRFYPLAGWARGDVFRYIKLNKLPLPAEYRIGLRRSSQGFHAEELEAIATHYPEDHKRIIKRFPLLDALRARERMYGKTK